MKAQILFDSESLARYINKDFSKNDKICAKLTKQMTTIENQAVLTLEIAASPGIVQIKEYTKKLCLTVCSFNHNEIVEKLFAKNMTNQLTLKLTKHSLRTTKNSYRL